MKTSKAMLWLFGAMVCVFVLEAPCLAQQIIQMRMAEQNPEMAWGPTHAERAWARRVEEATKGRVKIDIFYGQTLAKGPDIWNAVKNGVADIGWCFHGFWPDMTPLSEVIALPSLPFTTAEKGSEVLWRLYEKFPALQNEYRDVHVIHLFTSPPYLLATKKQVKTLEDLKGMKIKALGGPPSEQIRRLGAIPTPITMPDTYMSMDKGVIDGMGVPWEAVGAYRFFEVAKYYTLVPLSAVYFSISMNKQKWDSLPKDIQQAISSVGGLEAAKFWGRNWFDTAEENVNLLAKKGGHQIVTYTPPASELERWRKIGGEPLWNEWVKKMETKGHPEASQILNATLEMLKK